MGTYTTNYNLFLPTIGETGWGTLVNGNFSTIDTTMKSLSNRITAVENEVNGNLSCTSVTTSGKVTANGGVAGTTGTFSGAVTAATFNGIKIKSSFTVTKQSTYNSNVNDGYSYSDIQRMTYLCPHMLGVTYSGSLTFKGVSSSGNSGLGLFDGKNFIQQYLGLNSTYTWTFSNATCVAYGCEYSGSTPRVQVTNCAIT